MPFPFIAPIKPWIKRKLEKREQFSYENFRLSPFVILTSGAVVLKAREGMNIPNIIKTKQYDGAFKGCVISNQSEFSKLYQTSNTILGYDLDGNPIGIGGESGRKISTPIIQSVEIDTDGGNNTLKEAHVKVKCFSLKQLEMFDLFFLRPSMKVILEYGWNTDIVGKTEIDNILFAKKKHETYVKEFASLFDDAKVAKDMYLENLEKTDGNYDYMAGNVTEYTYSPVEDGTYDIDVTISAGNELQLFTPMKQSNADSTTAKKGTVQEPAFNAWLRKVSADFNLPGIMVLDKAKWESEFFNWEQMNAKDKDKVVSFDAYVSFRLIKELLQNSQNLKVFKSSGDKDKIQITYFLDAAKTKEIIPMNSHEYMISSNEDIIIPNKLPVFAFDTSKDKQNVLVIDENKKATDASINGKTFNNKGITLYDANGQLVLMPTDKVYGNLLNVFIKYDTVLNIYNQSYTQIDFINGIIGLVNENTYGLAKLEIMTANDNPSYTGKSLQIIDYKLFTKPPEQSELQKAYRFKIGPSGSIVKEFSFSMELGELAQAQALYQSQLNLNSINAGETFDNSSNSFTNNEAYTLFDMSFAQNSDGYFSINEVEKEVVLLTAKNNKQKTITHNVQPAAKKTEADKEVENLQDVVKKKSIKFKVGKENKTLIFLDTGVIKNKINKETKGSALTYLDISFAIDGMAGLSCGEYFQIDGIPEIYNKNGIFQITNVKQGIDENGWKTTIEAGYRVNIEAVIPKT
jgi:hypothetical protein